MLILNNVATCEQLVLVCMDDLHHIHGQLSKSSRQLIKHHHRTSNQLTSTEGGIFEAQHVVVLKLQVKFVQIVYVFNIEHIKNDFISYLESI